MNNCKDAWREAGFVGLEQYSEVQAENRDCQGEHLQNCPQCKPTVQNTASGSPAFSHCTAHHETFMLKLQSIQAPEKVLWYVKHQIHGTNKSQYFLYCIVFPLDICILPVHVHHYWQ